MHIFFLVLSVIMALVMVLDFTKYIIPNWLVGLLLLCYPPMVLMSHGAVPWPYGIGVMLATFAVGYVIYIKKWMGGGDVKLLAACALWVGPWHMPDFLFIMALLGGALALALIMIRRVLPRFLPDVATSPNLFRIFQEGAPLPYGLAIAAAFLILLWQQQLPGLILH